MFQVGDKLELKKFDGIIEVIGIYPSGQGGLKENEYDVILNGSKMRLQENMMGQIFREAMPEIIEFKDSDGEEIGDEEIEELPSDSEEVKEEKRKRGRPAKKNQD